VSSPLLIFVAYWAVAKQFKPKALWLDLVPITLKLCKRKKKKKKKQN